MKRDAMLELSRARQTFDEVVDGIEISAGNLIALRAAASAWAKAAAIAALCELARGTKSATATLGPN